MKVEAIASLQSKKVKSLRSGFVFTHSGFSGPSILDISHHFTKGEQPTITVNWLGIPDAISFWEKTLLDREFGKSLVVHRIRRHIPERLANALCSEAGVLERFVVLYHY